jgi:hypothetical protein
LLQGLPVPLTGHDCVKQFSAAIQVEASSSRGAVIHGEASKWLLLLPPSHGCALASAKWEAVGDRDSLVCHYMCSPVGMMCSHMHSPNLDTVSGNSLLFSAGLTADNQEINPVASNL